MLKKFRANVLKENANTTPRILFFCCSFDSAPPNSVPGELRSALKVKQTDIMTKKINKPELAILNDICVTVAS